MSRTSNTEHEFSTAKLYGEPAFADLTVRLPFARLRLHKIILCTKSEWFKRALAPGGRYGVCLQSPKICEWEANAPQPAVNAITLTDNSSHALEAMFRYIYTSEYKVDPHACRHVDETSHCYLNVAIVAEQYEIYSLKDLALSHLQALRNSFSADTSISLAKQAGMKFIHRDARRGCTAHGGM